MPNQALSDAPDTDAVLSFNDVTVGYGSRIILRSISMQVKRGEVVAVIGGSGSGKTTLLRAATGQIPVQQGSLTAFGQTLNANDARRLYEQRQRMGVLFQQGALFTDLDVFENVAFPLREHVQLPEQDIQQRVLSKLHDVGLRGAAHLKTSEISGGMARRVALARAIVLEPELIFYDEPFAGLDPISLGVIAQLIRSMSQTLGCGALLITHDLEESFAIADQVYLLGRGSLVASGTPQALLDSSDPFVQQFLKGQPDGPVAFHYPETPAFQAWLEGKQGGKS